MKQIRRQAFAVVAGPESARAELRAFAMAAAVHGIRLRPVNSFVEKRRLIDGRESVSVEWHLEPCDPSKVHQTHELRQRWDDPAWVEANPTEPIAMLRAFWDALREAEAHENQSVPLAVVTKGRRHVFIPMDATPELKAQLLAMLKEK